MQLCLSLVVSLSRICDIVCISSAEISYNDEAANPIAMQPPHGIGWESTSGCALLLLECVADPTQPAIPMSRRRLGLGPPEPTTYQGLGPSLTQKTNLIGEGYSILYAMLP